MLDSRHEGSYGKTIRSGERLAILIEGDRELILASYQEALTKSQCHVMYDPICRERVLHSCEEILDDVVRSVRENDVRVDDGYKRVPWAERERNASSGLTPADSLRMVVTFFNLAVRLVARHVVAEPDLIAPFTIAIIALNESLSQRTRETTLSYTGYLLDRIHRAHRDERRRIARELHDRLGEGMSGALRQIELHELTDPGEPPGQRAPQPSGRPAPRKPPRKAPQGTPHTAFAKGALMEAMDRLRLVICDLRQDLVTNLEKALTDYIAAAAASVDVRLRVSGDESWAPPKVIDETFLILREALRNALTHAAPRLVLVGVELEPHELRAWVADDGQGFRPRSRETRRSAGLATMRERASLLGGNLSVTSAPGEGTRIELAVPLPGAPVT